MATSVSPATNHARDSGSRRGPSYTTTPKRTPSTSTRSSVVPPSPHRASSSYHDPPSRREAPLQDVLPHRDHETTNVARPSASRRTSRDGPPSGRPDPDRSGRRRSTSRSNPPSNHNRDGSQMSTTTAAPGGTPSSPGDARHPAGGRPPKSRTTIPAPTGNWVLGKTIGAGSMGKVKLARRVEGGEQVSIIAHHDTSLRLIIAIRLPSR